MSIILLNTINQAAVLHSRGPNRTAVPLTTGEWIGVGIVIIFFLVLAYVLWKEISKEISRK